MIRTKQFFKKILLSITLMSFASIGYAQTNLLSVRMADTPTATHVIFIFNNAPEYRAFMLAHPDRLVLDLKKMHLSTGMHNIMLPRNAINNIRVGYPNRTTLRVVLDLNAAVKYKTLFFKRNNELIVEINNAPNAKRKLAVPRQPVTKSNPLVVVIDPGHGGKDPGALGVNGAKEKDVVLTIAKHLVDLINQDPRMHAVLTRDGDYFVPLRDRLKLARKGKADLFVAIHADSYFDDHS